MIEDKNIRLQDMGGETDLCCPRCGADNLHHSTVTVFDGGSEDPQTVVRTTVYGGSTKMECVPEKGSGNPSARRHGLTIKFWCEGCGGDSPGDLIELKIAQHKGSTEIGWRYTPRKPKP